MAVVYFDQAKLDEALAKPEMVLLQFGAGWCGLCDQLAPVIARAAERHPDILFMKVDTEYFPDFAKKMDVVNIPTMKIMRDGLCVSTQIGKLDDNRLEQWIAKAASLDMVRTRKDLEFAAALTTKPKTPQTV